MKSNEKIIEKIKVKDLELLRGNPRLDLDDDDDILMEMIKDQNNQIFNLAQDIYKKGLSPLDIFALVEYEDTPGTYYVAEGNRRLTSLILLQNHYILEKNFKSLYKKFDDLLNSKNGTIPTHVNAVVYNDEFDDDLQHWLQIRHLGKNEGVGTDDWDAMMKERHRKKLGQAAPTLTFIEDLEKKGILDSKTISKVNKTNWDRILGSIGQEYLNLKKENGLFVIPDDPQFDRKILLTAEMLANAPVKVVYDNEAIFSFFDKVDSRINNDKNEFKNTVQEVGEKTPPKVQSKQKEDVKKLTIPKPKKDIFENSATVIPRTHPIKSSNHRINGIINELKTLSVDDYPNASSLLLLSLFEMASSFYLEKKTGQNQTDNNFSSVIKAARNQLTQDKLISKADSRSIAHDSENIREVRNGYIHDYKNFPNSDLLRNYFKRHENFLRACLSI